MAIYQSTEEILAGPADSCFTYIGDLDCFRRQFSPCTIYIYIILAMKRTKHLETILVLILALGVFYWIFEISAFLIIAGGLVTVALFLPKLTGIIHLIWMKVAQMLGSIMSIFLLAIIFLLLLIPLAFLATIFGSRNGINLKSGSDTYFSDRSFEYDAASMEHPW